MTTRKNQNSILVLATLGVYLGLVLVGATPQVLAQAAMTRQFNVKDEIEVKDDLDKKPDPTVEEFDDAIETYFKDLKHFVGNLRKLHSIDEFNTSFHTFNTHHVAFSPCPATGIAMSRDEKSYIDRWLVPVIEEANFAADNSNFLSDCLPVDDGKEGSRARSAGISLSLDKTELKYQLSFNLRSVERAKFIHEDLVKAFQRFYIETEGDEASLIAVLYENTKLTQANNQVIVITRLPRAGLDSLLAANAK